MRLLSQQHFSTIIQVLRSTQCALMNESDVLRAQVHDKTAVDMLQKIVNIFGGKTTQSEPL